MMRDMAVTPYFYVDFSVIYGTIKLEEKIEKNAYDCTLFGHSNRVDRCQQ